MKNPIKNSADKILEKFQKIEEKGQTALGPALLSAIYMISNANPGSMIILCTDGLANLGLGSFDVAASEEDLQTSNKFYEEIANLAKSFGIAISVVTIKGEACKMEVLNKLADITNGNVTRVNPQDLSKNFANML